MYCTFILNTVVNILQYMTNYVSESLLRIPDPDPTFHFDADLDPEKDPSHIGDAILRPLA
jgi:hypothetical protein